MAQRMVIRRGCAVLGAVALWMAAAGPADAGTTKRCGGSGGNRTLTLSCPAGEFIIGLSGSGRTYVEDIGIQCGKYDARTLTYEASGERKIGPKRVLHDGFGRCHAARAVTNLSTSSGWYLDKLTHGYCANCHPGRACFDVSETFTVNVGGSGGGRCDAQCPKGEALYKVVIRYGMWIDSVQGYCRRP